MADFWDAETCAAALDGAGLGGLFGGTPRRRRGVDWEAAAQRMDYFVSALRDAVPGEAPPPPRAADDAPGASDAVEVTPRRPRPSDAAAACCSPVAQRNTWRGVDASEAERRKAEAAAADTDAAERARRAPAAHAYAQAHVYRGGSGDENEGIVDNDAEFDDFDETETLLKRSSSVPVGFYGSDGACSTRERALHAHVAALEAELRRARLAGALREMRAACGDLAGASLAQAAAAGSPGAAPRRRAEAAEAAVAELRAERDSAMARCDSLEERLGTATDTIALLRRRLEAAETSGSGPSYTSYTQAPPAPPQPASARVQEAVAAAVAAAEALPSAQRRRRLRALRLRWHPDKHGGDGGDALSALATEVTQALNQQIEAMQRRAALRGSDDDASDG